MDISELMEYAYKRIDNNIVDDDLKEGLDELILRLGEVGTHSKELWFEIHFDQTTDFIFEIQEIESLRKVSEAFIKQTDNEVRKAWLRIHRITEAIQQEHIFLERYMHVASLEFDMDEIKSKRYCPCCFFEFDFEQIIKDNVDIKEVYKMFEEKVLIELLGMNEKIMLKSQVIKLIEKKIYLWNVGFMMSRSTELRLFFVPVNKKELIEAMNILQCSSNDSRLLDIDENVEFMIDFDCTDIGCSNIGISIYPKKNETRIGILKSIIEDKHLDKEKYKCISNWSHKEIVSIQGEKRLLYWQLAHFKLKLSVQNVTPKLYLRLMVM